MNNAAGNWWDPAALSVVGSELRRSFFGGDAAFPFDSFNLRA